MPTAPIDCKGGEIFFTDTGPVSGSDSYTTLVIYHGSGVTGHILHKLSPLGMKKNIRVVIPNRRDYPGSTKYTDEELEDLKAGRKIFLERLGMEVAHFLIWFAEKYDIPKISTDRKSGGFAVMGWSMGNATPLALLGHPDAIPKEAYVKLQPYFRQFIMYDPPHFAFGYDQPEGYDPLADPDLKTPAEVFENFAYWVCTYYSHPNLASRSIAGLDFSKRGTRPSIENMSQDEIKVNYDEIATGRVELPMFVRPMQATLKEQAKCGLFDEALAQSVLPGTQIIFLTCSASCWFCLWGFFETEKRYNEYVSRGCKVRPIRFVEIKNANHFVHWDEPENFFAITADAIHN